MSPIVEFALAGVIVAVCIGIGVLVGLTIAVVVRSFLWRRF